MKTLLTLSLVVLMAGAAFAQMPNSLGIFFVDSGYEVPENAAANTNMDVTGAPFNAYLCILESSVYSVAAYEMSLDFGGASVFILGVTGPNGWTNLGSPTNQIVGYQVPVPTTDGHVVLATINMLYSAPETVNIVMGPSTPSSFGGEGPGIADGIDVNNLVLCNYTSCDEEMPGLVATINGSGIEFCGVIATEAHSLSSVKALFN